MAQKSQPNLLTLFSVSCVADINFIAFAFVTQTGGSATIQQPAVMLSGSVASHRTIHLTWSPNTYSILHTPFPTTPLLLFTTNDWLIRSGARFPRNPLTRSLLPSDGLWLCRWPAADVSLAYRGCLTRHGSYLPFLIPPQRTINSGLNDIW